MTQRFIKALIGILSVFVVQGISAQETSQTLERERLIELIRKTSEEHAQNGPINKVFSREMNRYDSEVISQIHKVAKRQFPKGTVLNGKVTISIMIRVDGVLEAADLVKTSGNELIDQFAIELIEKASPFPRLSQTIAKDTEILVLTKTFNFNQENEHPIVEKSN